MGDYTRVVDQRRLAIIVKVVAPRIIKALAGVTSIDQKEERALE